MSAYDTRIRLPAPFTLFQTVPKVSPKPGNHPVLEVQSVFWFILPNMHSVCDFKAQSSSFSAEPQSAVFVPSRTDKSIGDTVKVGARYALKCGVLLQTSPLSQQSASPHTLLNLV